jgi:Fe-S-cluster containining protein
MADIDRPSTWKPFKASMCNNCQAGCCHLPVEARLSDLVRLGLVDENVHLLSPKKVAAQLIKAGIVQNYRERTGLFMLAQKASRACIFLDDQARCTVYDKRPDTCRNFPRIGPRSNFCPHQPKSQKPV